MWDEGTLCGIKGSMLEAHWALFSSLGNTSPGHGLQTFKLVCFGFQKHWVLIFAGDKCCFMLCSLPAWLLTPSTAGLFPARPPPGSLGAPRTSGNLNRVWARNVAGCPMTGSWVSKTAFPKRNLGFLLKSFLLPSVFLFFHFCNWYHRSLSGSSPQHKSPSWFYFPSLPTSVSPITAPFKIYLQEIYFSSSPLSPFFATTSN